VPEELRAAARSVQQWNALLEDCHNQAIFAAWDAKLKLLLQHYSLADDDWYGLALILAVEHELGFQIDRQIAPLPPGFWGAVEIKDKMAKSSMTRLGSLIDHLCGHSGAYLNYLKTCRRKRKNLVAIRTSTLCGASHVKNGNLRRTTKADLRPGFGLSEIVCAGPSGSSVPWLRRQLN
jgi:hypothetical protein